MPSVPESSNPHSEPSLEDPFRLVTDALPVAVAFIDRERRFIHHNSAWREWAGDSPLVGRPLWEILGPDAYESFRPKVEEALEGRRTQLETWVRPAPLGPRCLEITCIPQGTPGNERRGFILLATDITARKHREESEELLRRADALFSLSTDERSVLRSFLSLLVPHFGDGATLELREPSGAGSRLVLRSAHSAETRIIDGGAPLPQAGPEIDSGAPEAWSSGRSQLLSPMGDEILARSASLREQLRILKLPAALSALFVPLSARGRTIGVLSLFSKRSGRPYVVEDLWLAEDLGRQAAGAIEAARLRTELSAESAHRKRTEEALRERRLQLRLESEAAELATWDWDIQSRVLTLNERCRALWALPPSAEVDYRVLLSAIHSEDRERVRQVLGDEARTGQRGACRTEFRVIGLGDGVERWVSAQGRVVFDASRRPIRMIGTAIEISEQKKVERELLLRKTLLEAQTEAALDGILVVDLAGRILSVNGRFVAMWGLAPEVIAARSDGAAISSVLHKLADPESFMVRVRYLYDHLDEESRDEISLKDGRTFDRYSAPVRNPEAGLYGRVWYFRDITDMKRRDEELRQSAHRLQTALDELNGFAYSVAHDLRAPLRAMAGFSDLLRKEFGHGIDEEAHDYLHRIATAAQRMDELIQDLLNYSRVSRVHVRIEKVELGPLVTEILGRCEGEIHERQARVEVQQPLPCVLAYRVALDQVLANLISNAVKFVGDGVRPEIQIRAERLGEAVRLSIIDNGIGIPSEQQERIFGVFERLHPEAQYPGTGIGLAIVKRAMERMGGRVGVESVPGVGSRFWIELRSAEGSAP
jgi:PAS domain S-box-containing protein